MNRFVLLACGWLVAWGVGAASPVVLAAQEPATKSAESAPPADEDAAAKAAETAPAPAGETAEHAPAADDASHAGESHPAAEHAGADHAGADHAGADHAHHDPTDLSHGDPSAQLKAAQELRFDLGIATFVVFLLLLAILTKFAWGPIAAGLDRREELIARQIDEARAASALAAKQLQDYERKVAAATDEARTMVAQARQDAEMAKERIVAEAQQAAQKERERAVADISSAKNEALREIAEKSVSTAISLASSIVRREVKPEDHDQLIDESLQKFSRLN